jgi:hypothetical protein
MSFGGRTSGVGMKKAGRNSPGFLYQVRNVRVQFTPTAVQASEVRCASVLPEP